MELLLTAVVVTAVYVAVVWTFFSEEVRAVLERDPAGTNFLEVALTYAGVHAIISHRIAHQLWKWGVPFLPRWVSQVSRWITGIEIHQAAQIGRSLFIDHGMGVVIGETTIIGDNVTLYQGVTLGGTGKEKGKRHPTLGNNVFVGSGAKILGNITIGDNVFVGSNSVVLRDVPPNCTVVGIPGTIVRREGRPVSGLRVDVKNLPDPLAERIEFLQREIDHIEAELREWRESGGHKQAAAQAQTDRATAGRTGADQSTPS